MPSGILFLRFAGGDPGRSAAYITGVSRAEIPVADCPENEAVIYIPCCEYSYRGDAAGAMPRCGKVEKTPKANR